MQIEIERLRAVNVVKDKEIVALSAKVQELKEQIKRLRSGEFICVKCGLRKNADVATGADF